MSLPLLPKEPKQFNSHQPSTHVDGPTIAARLTGVGQSAIAVIGLRGPLTQLAISACFQPATNRPLEVGQIRYGQWKSGESIVVTPVGHEFIEIHCHGGAAAITCILQDLSKLGVSVVPAPEFKTSTPGSPDDSLLVQEAKQVLTQCTTTRTAAIAMHQVRGATQVWADRYQRQIISAAETISQLEPSIEQLLERARFTTRMTKPFRVVLIGSPNVGKSSLVNAMVGFERSITTEIAGTTRDVLHAATVMDGVPIQLSDTAGVREAADAIEREGILHAQNEVSAADVIVRVRDPLNEFVELAISPDQAMIDVFNKSDLGSDANTEAILVSATTGFGIETLMQSIVRAIVPVGIDDGGPALLNQRQLAWAKTLQAQSRSHPR